MRNLKKVLALVLALVMTMSLVTIANASDFTDSDKITYNEAVDVMTAIGVLDGLDTGAFNPKGTLTREQAAKIICTMMLGENADKLGTSSSSFKDVAATRWSSPYIEYCASIGIIAGNGDGTFNPTGKLTGHAFAKMLLGALGYSSDYEGYTGAGWSIEVAKDAVAAGIDVDGVAMSADLTREQAAQMAFQTLTADMVEYKTAGTTIITTDGTQVITGGSTASKLAGSASANYDNASSGDSVMQFCEQYFAKLKKVAGDTDDFGRPADYKWKLDADDVCNVVKKAAITFTAETSLDDVVKAIKGYTFNGTKVIDKTTTVGTTSTAIGDLSFTGSTEAIAQAVKDETMNGRVVEIYADSNDKGVDDVVILTYTVGEVTKVTTNKDGDVTYTISNGAGTKTDYADPDKTDTIDVNGTIAKDDVVTFIQGSSKLHVYPTTSFTGAQSAYNTSKKTITVEGQTYTVANGVKKDASNFLAVTDFGNSNKSDNVYYVDQYGYVVKSTAKAASTDYVYIVSAYGKLNSSIDGSTPYVEVRGVLADGTVGVYQIAVEEKSSTWYLKGTNTPITITDDSTVQSFADSLKTTAVYGYTLDGKVMTLEPLGTTLADGSTTLVGYNTNAIEKNDTSVVSSGKTVLLNKDVTIVIYDDDAKSAKVISGTANLGSTDLDSYKAVVSGSSATVGTASIVFDTVTNGVVSESSNYAFIDATKYSTILDGSTEKYVYTGYLADGSTIDLTATAKLTPTTASSSSVGLYKYTSDNTVANSDLLRQQDNVDTLQNTKYGYGRLTATGNMLTMGSTGNYYDVSNASVVYIDGSLAEINDNVGFFVLKTDNGTLTNDVETVFIFRD